MPRASWRRKRRTLRKRAKLIAATASAAAGVSVQHPHRCPRASQEEDQQQRQHPREVDRSRCVSLRRYVGVPASQYALGQHVQYNTLSANGWIDVTIVKVHTDNPTGEYYSITYITTSGTQSAAKQTMPDDVRLRPVPTAAVAVAPARGPPRAQYYALGAGFGELRVEEIQPLRPLGLAGLFYGLGVLPGKRNDSFSEVPWDELDGGDCKAKV